MFVVKTKQQKEENLKPLTNLGLEPVMFQG